jgi:hypothetical protein
MQTLTEPGDRVMAFERQASCALSINQEARLLLEMTRTGRLAPFHLLRCFGLNGPLDPSLVERAVNDVIQRHEGLRTGFAPVRSPAAMRSDGDKASLGRVGGPPRFRPFCTDAELPLVLTSIDRGDAAQREADALALLIDEACRTFDLGQPPLVRAVLVRVSAERHLLLVVVHHLLVDGWSMQILDRELRAILLARLDGRTAVLPEPPFHYHDFAAWQRKRLASGQLDASLSYWTERWEQYGNEQLRLSDFPLAPDGGRGTLTVDEERQTIDPALYAGIQAFLTRRRVTLYMLLLTAFVRALHLTTGRGKLAIWGQFANRMRAETEMLIGWCANAHLLGVTCEPGGSLEALLDQVRDVVLKASRHQEVPPGALWASFETSRDAPRVRFLSDAWVSFDLRSSREPDSGHRMEPIDLPLVRAVRGIQLVGLQKKDDVSLALRYTRDTFSRDGVRALLAATHDALLTMLATASAASRAYA